MDKYYLQCFVGSWDHDRQACLRAHRKSAEKPCFYLKKVPWSLAHPSSPELSKKLKHILLLTIDKLFPVKGHPTQAETQLGSQATTKLAARL